MTLKEKPLTGSHKDLEDYPKNQISISPTFSHSIIFIMKRSSFFSAFCLFFFAAFLLTNCEKVPLDPDNSGSGNGGGSTSVPPTASFSYSPQSGIIADQTSVQFNNSSSGTITSQSWDFGVGESSSSSSSPSYTFSREGDKSVTLNVSGPAGSDTKVVHNVRVHAMDPNLHNYNYASTHTTGDISFIRNNGMLWTGNLRFQNNYGGDVIVELYHPDTWLAGQYTPFGNVTWTVPTNLPNYTLLLYNGSNIVIGNDWGIRVRFTNGATSCIRTIHAVATYSGGKFSVIASKVYEG